MGWFTKTEEKWYVQILFSENRYMDSALEYEFKTEREADRYIEQIKIDCEKTPWKYSEGTWYNLRMITSIRKFSL